MAGFLSGGGGSMLKYIRNQWDRVGAWVCIVAGAVALLLGYLGVSGTLDTAKQIPFVVSGGMTGLFLLGLGALLWLAADLRDEWRKLDAIDRHLTETGSLPPAEAGDDSGARTVNRGKGEPATRREVSLR
ncbi:MAG TPA: hypothetical protein VEG38_01585 [Acidimicrobiia bacterium]|nr:hypothetical protein [Acidimicrobiia bacterium]